MHRPSPTPRSRPARSSKSNNIMYDKRVVRGSTYAMPVIPPVSARRDAAIASLPTPPTPLPRRLTQSTVLVRPFPQSVAIEQNRDKKDREQRTQRALNASRRAADEERAALSRTPPPVAGRRHAEANTEVFLEVLSDRAPEEEAGVQTDAHIDRPPEPVFVPQPVSPAAKPARPPKPRSTHRPSPVLDSSDPTPRSPASTRRRRSRPATSSTLTSR